MAKKKIKKFSELKTIKQKREMFENMAKDLVTMTRNQGALYTARGLASSISFLEKHNIEEVLKDMLSEVLLAFLVDKDESPSTDKGKEFLRSIFDSCKADMTKDQLEMEKQTKERLK